MTHELVQPTDNKPTVNEIKARALLDCLTQKKEDWKILGILIEGEGPKGVDKLDEPGIRERISNVLKRLSWAVEENSQLTFYESTVNYFGLINGGSLYPQEGLNVYSRLSFSKKSYSLFCACRELVGRFMTKSKTPIEPLSGVSFKLMSNENTITPSDVEVSLACGIVLDKLVEIQKRRIERNQLEGVKKWLDQRKELMIGGFAFGRDAAIIAYCNNVVSLLPQVRGIDQRTKIVEAFNGLLSL